MWLVSSGAKFACEKSYKQGPCLGIAYNSISVSIPSDTLVQKSGLHSRRRLDRDLANLLKCNKKIALALGGMLT